MIRVHIVKFEDTWILKRVAESIKLPTMQTTVGNEASPRADVNFFVNYMAFHGNMSGTLNVPWMTHFPARLDDAGRRQRRWHDAVGRADHCIAMCQQSARFCKASKTSIWGGAPDERFVKRPIRLGVCAKLSRRKRPERIEALRSLDGVEVVCTEGKLRSEEMPDFYRSLDYLVITSDTEGGPYPVMEAVAMGVPVIAPDVGWSWEYPTIHYDGTTDGLLATVRKLVFPTNTWEVASLQLEAIFKQILETAR